MSKKGILVAGSLAVAGLLLALLIVIKIMLDPNALKPELQKQVKLLTGLQLELQGDISLKFYPWFGIKLGPASLGSPQGFKHKLASVEKLSLETRLLPLLQGKIDAKSMEIEGLDLNIVRNAEGRWNFQLMPVKKVSVHEDEVIVDTIQGDQYIFSYLIRGLDLKNASARVIDEMYGQRYEIRNCVVSAHDVESGKPFDSLISFDGSSTQPRLSGSVQLRSMVSMFPQALRFVFDDVKLDANVEAQGLPFTKAGLALSMDTQILAQQGVFDLTRLDADAVVNGGFFGKEAHAYLHGTGSLDLQEGVAETHLTQLDSLGLKSEVTASATNVLQDPQLTAQVRTNTFDLKKVLGGCGLRPEWMDRVEGLDRCSYDGTVLLNKKTLKLDTTALHVDDAALQVKASLDLPDGRGVDLAVSGSRFDFCRVLPHAAQGKQGKSASVVKEHSAKESRQLSLHDYHGTLQLELGDLLCGKESVGRLDLKASLSEGKLAVPKLQLKMRHSSLEGELQASFPKKGYEPDSGKARISLRSENLRNAAKRLGYTLGPTKDPSVWGKVILDLEAGFNPDGYVLHAPSFELDGNVSSLAILASKPFPSNLSVDIKSGTLDLNRYKPADGKDKKKTEKKNQGSGTRISDFELPDFFRRTKCSLKLQFAKLRYDLFDVSKLRVTAVSDKGKITVSDLRGACFDGTINSTGSVNLQRRPAPLAIKLSAEGIDIEQFIAALGRRPHVTGRANLKADVTSRGFTSKEFFSGLNGNGTAQVVQGSILGLNLSSSALSSQQGIVGPKARTLFEKADIKATAEKGTMHFSRFDVTYTPNKINGTGTIVLPKNTISARLNANLQGLPVLPITITGKLDKPDVSLDGGALVGNVLEGAANVVKDILLSPLTIEQGIQGGIENLFSSDKKNDKKKK